MSDMQLNYISDYSTLQADRNLGSEVAPYEANAASRAVSWERRRSQYNQFSTYYCTGGLVRSDNEARMLYTVEKKALF